MIKKIDGFHVGFIVSIIQIGIGDIYRYYKNKEYKKKNNLLFNKYKIK